MAWPIEAYLEERSLELAPRTIATYRGILRDAERRTACEISTLTSRRLLELASSWSWRDQSLSALRGFLRWTKSPAASLVPRGIPPGSHRQLTWYTVAELEAIVQACSTPRERLIVHLACELMLRRVEIERLTWQDLEPTSIRILGKGRHGGKVRRIPYHPYTRQVVSAFTGSRTGSGSASAPSSSALVVLKKSALDKELKAVEESLRWDGVSLSLEFHALRRTGARMFLAAAAQIGKGPLESLLELRGLLGHSSVTTTMRYVGWEIENAGATMAAMPRLENRTAPALAPAPRVYGPGGITVHEPLTRPRPPRPKTP